MSLIENLNRLGVHGPGDIEWLHLLTNEWQIIADTGYCDLLLWVPNSGTIEGYFSLSQALPPTAGFVSIAQIRPSTTHTVFHTDWVGKELNPQLCERAIASWNSQTPKSLVDEQNLTDIVLDTEFIPLSRNDRPVALLSVHRESIGTRKRQKAERVYRDVSHHLLQMASRGAWPEFSAPVGTAHGNPRVSDGLLMLDTDGRVTYASPNALSIYKRINYSDDMIGLSLLDITRGLLPAGEKADETLPLVLTGRMPWRAEIRAAHKNITFRSIPLRHFSRLGEERYGAVLLCRDVTELRRREQEMMSKDATIREIHHRVKNNLQTVSALLRLQARRMTTPEAKEGMEQAMRRVATIALVHEALSQGLTQDVDFDDLVGRQFHLVAELASPGQHVDTRVEGSFGRLPSQIATPLALVINEVVANAVEHGLAGETGTVTLSCSHHYTEKQEHSMEVTITDSGEGISADRIRDLESGRGSTGLGTQIIRTLVASELNGRIHWSLADGGGTRVTIQVAIL
ncbi:sensor histidine kinase [Rothia nasisuis]|uniref:sensor histidine kinase n=1 Tax=Rothia nasisuis TaxID=2109647 RepID=UPI001F3E1194|nr:PAS domain-containing sensor histidine kinase [Rothia nasisuis]